MSKKELLELSEQDVINYLIDNGVNVETDIDEHLNSWFEWYTGQGNSFVDAVNMVVGEPYLEDGGDYYYIMETGYNYPCVECSFCDLESLVDYCEEQGYITFEE